MNNELYNIIINCINSKTLNISSPVQILCTIVACTICDHALNMSGLSLCYSYLKLLKAQLISKAVFVLRELLLSDIQSDHNLNTFKHDLNL